MLTVESSNQETRELHTLSLRHRLLICLLLFAVVFIVFGKALGGNFIADDAWYLPIIWRGFHGEPALIWHQLQAPYTYRESLYVMYRPLVVFSWSLDYLVWHLNPFGYHLSNLIYHAINSCLVFWVSRLLLRFLLLNDGEKLNLDQSVAWKIPLMVSLAFAVYPGQVEPTCWVMCRIDSLAAIFYFCALGTMLQYWLGGNKSCFWSSIIALFFGLATKEVCVTAPLVLMMVWLCKKYRAPGSAGAAREIFAFFQSIWPMLALICVYIVVRAAALGTPIGGYTGSLGLYLNHSFLTRLLNINNYWALLHPIDQYILGANSAADIGLRAIYSIIAVLLVLNYKTTPCMIRRLKLACWFLGIALLMFIPSLQIWFVSKGMMGTRLVYHMCLPTLLAVVLLLHPVATNGNSKANRLRKASYVVLILFVLTCSYISSIYAGAWREASNTVAKIRRDIVTEAATLPPREKLVLLNLPSDFDGLVAFFTIDFLPGLLRPGLCESDLSSRVISIDGAPLNLRLLNFSRLKDLVEHQGQYQFFAYSPADKQLHRMFFPRSSEINAPDRRELSIRDIGKFETVNIFDENKSHFFFTNNRAGKYFQSYKMELNPPAHPFDAELMELKISCRPHKSWLKQRLDDLQRALPDQEEKWQPVDKADGRSASYVDNAGYLSWDTQAHAVGELVLPVAFSVFDGEHVTYRINLTQYKRWILAGEVREFRLDLPIEEYSYDLESVSLLRNADSFVPKLHFAGKGVMNTCGLYELEANDLRFSFDASKIRNARGIIAEVSRPYCEFDFVSGTLRDRKPCKYALHTMRMDKLQGELTVPPGMVRKPAYYQVRIAATDAHGEILGSFSDPVTVATVTGLP